MKLPKLVSGGDIFGFLYSGLVLLLFSHYQESRFPLKFRDYGQVSGKSIRHISLCMSSAVTKYATRYCI